MPPASRERSPGEHDVNVTARLFWDWPQRAGALDTRIPACSTTSAVVSASIFWGMGRVGATSLRESSSPLEDQGAISATQHWSVITWERMTLIYETKLLGSSVRVFTDHIEHKAGLGSGIQMIPISQIAGLKVGNWLANHLMIETTGGRKYTIVTNKKENIAEAIRQAQRELWSQPSGHQVVASCADELAKLALLRAQGILSDQEFDRQKMSVMARHAISPGAPSPPMDGHGAARTPVRRSGASSFMRKVKLAGAAVLVAVVVIFVLAVIAASVGPKKQTSNADSLHSESAGAAPNTGNKANDMLLALPGPEQASHLGNVIEEGCKGVRAFYMGIDENRNAFWSVACANGSSYEVMIDDDDNGSTTVLNCLAVKATADIDCFATLASQGNRPPRTRKQVMCAIARLPPKIREQTVRQFMQNLEDYVRDSGEPVPSTREQALKQFMHTLDSEARSCDERSPSPSRAPARQNRK